MLIDKQKIKEFLHSTRNNEKNVKIFDSFEKRRIPYTGWQLNMMFLNRKLGKTFMLYGFLAEEILEKLEKYKEVKLQYFKLKSIDSDIYRAGFCEDVIFVKDDVNNNKQFDEYLRNFSIFIERYYTELYFIKKNTISLKKK